MMLIDVKECAIIIIGGSMRTRVVGEVTSERMGSDSSRKPIQGSLCHASAGDSSRNPGNVEREMMKSRYNHRAFDRPGLAL